MKKHKRSTFSGKLGFVLSAAGASVGLGNIWRFPYLAAKYGGGIFLLVYIILALTFGYTSVSYTHLLCFCRFYIQPFWIDFFESNFLIGTNAYIIFLLCFVDLMIAYFHTSKKDMILDLSKIISLTTMSVRGFEPRTTWLKVKCSTTWATHPYIIVF